MIYYVYKYTFAKQKEDNEKKQFNGARRMAVKEKIKFNKYNIKKGAKL